MQYLSLALFAVWIAGVITVAVLSVKSLEIDNRKEVD